MSDSFYFALWGTLGVAGALGLIIGIFIIGNYLQAFLMASWIVLMRRLRKK